MLGPDFYSTRQKSKSSNTSSDIINGKSAGAGGYSEPNVGLTSSLRTKAEDMGDHYLINGSKVWTSYADKADWIFCLFVPILIAPSTMISFTV